MSEDTKNWLIGGCIVAIVVLVFIVISNRETTKRLRSDLETTSSQADDAASAASDAADAADEAASQAQDAQDRADALQSDLEDLQAESDY